MANFLNKVEDAFHHVTDGLRRASHDIEKAVEHETGSHPRMASRLHHVGAEHRFKSFVPDRTANGAKYYVDGCSYMWAVSVAIEQARHEIWIMDWWLSPELYLRRPPSKNESYRLDRMLKAAAERGVKVNIMIYKEVENVLSLNSSHSKKLLEGLHKNIAVARHPDHSPNAQVFVHEVFDVLKHFRSKGDKLDYMSPAELDDIVLFWAHHEKLILVDGKLAFMGGLDLCFGRWDTHQHSIADAHPENPEDVVFPGQDYNNARIFDFQDVGNWQRNKLDRNVDARMGWSDVSICLLGPVVDDLKAHFVQRWNFIYNEKYAPLSDARYAALTYTLPPVSNMPVGSEPSDKSITDNTTKIDTTKVDTTKIDTTKVDTTKIDTTKVDTTKIDTTKVDTTKIDTTKIDSSKAEGHQLLHHGSGLMESLTSHLHRHDTLPPPGKVSAQLLRSCSQWSHRIPTESSICNAYMDVIKDSQHFVYIENQFFITTTGDEQHPVKNQIGAALVERIVRAHNAGENYKVFVCIPAVPAFAGDIHEESMLGTRAIMEFQYKSICRGGHSIMEMVEKAGVPDATKYIRFYNLRNYDRINTVAFTRNAEQPSGVSNEPSRKQNDDLVGTGSKDQGGGAGESASQSHSAIESYPTSAAQISGKPGSAVDTESGSYSLNGPPVTSIPWTSHDVDDKVKELFPELSATEIDAFVSEELYIHSKVMIADDRFVVIGSANLNDRSQLGTHDSEIAVVIEDSDMVASKLNGTACQVARFAAGLRRTLFRKHLGLLPIQDYTKSQNDFLPPGQGDDKDTYDWGSREDRLVEDPLSDEFLNLWNNTASTNTAVFDHVFRPVPTNKVRNWKDYESYYGKYFIEPTLIQKPKPEDTSTRYKYGHVFKENFPGGVDDVKAELSKVRGTLVEMPLDFLSEVGALAEFGIAYNNITDDIYT